MSKNYIQKNIDLNFEFSIDFKYYHEWQKDSLKSLTKDKTTLATIKWDRKKFLCFISCWYYKWFSQKVLW